MTRRYIVAALMAMLVSHPAAAQSLTLTNLKAPIAKACGGGEAKSIAELWRQIIACRAAAPASPVPAGGFDGAWYLQQNTDVKAAGMDAKTHWDRYGKWEGRLPYAGAPVWRPTRAEDYATAPDPEIVVPDVYVPADATEARVRVKLQRFGKPLERSYTLGIYAANAQGGGFNLFNRTTSGPQLSLPSTGSEVEFVVTNWPAGQRGFFDVTISSASDTPRNFRGHARVYVGVEPPKGYVYPAPLEARTPTPLPQLGKPSYETDLKSLADWSTTPTARQINGMVGVWPAESWRTMSGKAVDVMPLVNGVRTLRIVDLRSDPLRDDKGALYPYAAGFLSRVLGDGRYGVQQVDVDIPVVRGVDAEFPWGIGARNEWPPELDSGETFGGDPTRPITWHPGYAPMIAFRPLVSQLGRHTWTMQRTPPDANGMSWYRQWRDGVLIVECPNYLGDYAMNTILSLEGPGGAGGSAEDGIDYGAVSAPVYAVRWWQQ